LSVIIPIREEAIMEETEREIRDKRNLAEQTRRILAVRLEEQESSRRIAILQIMEEALAHQPHEILKRHTRSPKNTVCEIDFDTSYPKIVVRQGDAECSIEFDRSHRSMLHVESWYGTDTWGSDEAEIASENVLRAMREGIAHKYFEVAPIVPPPVTRESQREQQRRRSTETAREQKK
jgi:hypothetical protein